MTKVELLRTFQISLDGLTVQAWPKGCTRIVSDDILRILISEGACAIVENKAHDAAPGNKSRVGRPRKVQE